MTIREIEALSGMTRANIRFYESEGLLTPNRMENGYRDYTRSDLDTLHKIRLLRALGAWDRRDPEALGRGDGAGRSA